MKIVKFNKLLLNIKYVMGSVIEQVFCISYTPNLQVNIWVCPF